jgi:hypothetical protein
MKVDRNNNIGTYAGTGIRLWVQCTSCVYKILFAVCRYPTRLLSSPNRNLGRVTRAEIEVMIDEIREDIINIRQQLFYCSQKNLFVRFEAHWYAYL